MTIHDPDKPIYIKTDASDKAIGAIARQDGYLLDYFLRKLSPAEANYTTSNKELTARQARWHEALLEYDFKIQHIKGTDNQQADALSRRPDYRVLPKVNKVILKYDKEVL